MSSPYSLAYAAIALAKAIQLAARLLGLNCELLDAAAEIVVLVAYISLRSRRIDDGAFWGRLRKEQNFSRKASRAAVPAIGGRNVDKDRLLDNS
jgi:hypothetical protein